MKSLFLAGETLKDFEGVSKKIIEQINALERLGLNVVLSDLKTDDKNKFIGRYVDGQIIDKYSKIDFLSKLQSRIKYKNLYKYIIANKIKLVYIRYAHFANPFFISFLKKLKKSGIKVLLEIPTYPYDKEYDSLKLTIKTLLWVERMSRRHFKNLVTLIITFTPETKIFGVPAIEISNGIEVNSICIVSPRETDDEIHLIGVASIAYWHGYDRVIEGIKNYYRRHQNIKRVFFHVIGDSSDAESLRYKKLVKQYNLTEYIKFHGKRFGKELDDLFNRADIGVGCLGCHRKGMRYSKSLKNREYCARGIPFFYSETDESFEKQNFIFKVPSSDSPVDIIEIIKFIDNNKFDRSQIREYALKNLTWDRQFEKVLSKALPAFKIPNTFHASLKDRLF